MTIPGDGHIVGIGKILVTYTNAKVYFVFNLSGLSEGKYWMILAGIHVVGDEIWL